MELHSVAEPAHESLRPSGQRSSRTVLSCCLAPLKFLLTTLLFLVVVLYMLVVGIFQGLGMLLMSQIMPSFMRLVYPSRLGQLHIVFLGLYRRWFIAEEGHSRPLTIDLLAYRAPVGSTVARAPESHADAPADAAASAVPYSVHTVACLLDNYSYVLIDRSGPPPHAAALVDPCEPAAVLRALKNISDNELHGETILPVAILTTHHREYHRSTAPLPRPRADALPPARRARCELPAIVAARLRGSAPRRLGPCCRQPESGQGVRWDPSVRRHRRPRLCGNAQAGRRRRRFCWRHPAARVLGALPHPRLARLPGASPCPRKKAAPRKAAEAGATRHRLRRDARSPPAPGPRSHPDHLWRRHTLLRRLRRTV